MGCQTFGETPVSGPTSFYTPCHMILCNMASDTTVVPSADRRAGDVMAAVDEDGGEERFVIADVSVEEAWLAAPTGASKSLAAMR